jgi:hypothetical protein
VAAFLADGKEVKHQKQGELDMIAAKRAKTNQSEEKIEKRVVL